MSYNIRTTLDVQDNLNIGLNASISGSLTVTGSINGNLNGTATSASYVLNAVSSSRAVSSSFANTASYVNPLNQTVIITGSLTTSGSNTLIGNTSLTGSLNISGSEIITGYMQLMPVTANINNTISASYIYVSGSTNDLYFTQNGQGYGNTTRLRWIEGNLYTGLLSGGVISSTPGSTTFNISSGSGIIVSLNAFTASQDPYPTIQYIKWPTYTAQPITNSGSAKITYVSINSAGTINQQIVPYGSTDITQWDTQIELGVVLHLSGSVSTGVYNAPQLGYGFAQRTDDFIRAFGPVKISGHTLQASGSSPTLSLIKGSGTSYNNGANYINNPNHPSTVIDPAVNISKIYRYYISGSTPIIDTGVANAGYTAIDSKYYVDTTTGTLALVGGTYWSIQRVFWIPNSPTNAFIVYYGNDRYRSLIDATNAKDSEPFIEAPNTAQNAIFLGYIIIQGGGSGTPARDLLNASEATIIPGGLFRSIGGIGSSGTSPIATTFSSLSDVSVASRVANDLLTYNGSQWVNTKSLTGDYSINGNLTVTGSLIGTASFANTASFAPNYLLLSNTGSMLAPYVLNSSTSSFTTTSSFNSFTSSVNSSISSLNTYTSSINNVTGSFVTTSSFNNFTSSINNKTGSFATTGSNVFIGNQTITGSLIISSSNNTQLLIGTNTLFVSSSGQVGIGTLTPLTPLHIKGTTSGSGVTAFRVENSSLSASLTVSDFGTVTTGGPLVIGNTAFSPVNGSSTIQTSFGYHAGQIDLKPNNLSSLIIFSNPGNGGGLYLGTYKYFSTPYSVYASGSVIVGDYSSFTNNTAAPARFAVSGSNNQTLVNIESPGLSSIFNVSGSGVVTINGAIPVTRNATGYNVGRLTNSASFDNIRVAISSSGNPVASSVSGSVNVFYSAISSVAGSAISSSVNTGAIFTTGSWSILTSATLGSGGDTITSHIQDQDRGRLYRATFIQTAGPASGSVVIERLI